LSDADLVAILLGTETNAGSIQKVAARVLEKYGGLAGLSRVGLGAFAEDSGIGLERGTRLIVAVEIGRRVIADAFRTDRLRFDDPRAVDAWARPRLAALDHEELWLLVLDPRNALRAARRVAMGGASAVSITAREPLGIALREGGHAMVLVHNHPSGDPRPSDHDIAFTRRIAEAATLVGIPLVDHVVVARMGAISMLSQGLLGSPPERGEGGSERIEAQSDQT
jgi:DNA repair protein RadC